MISCSIFSLFFGNKAREYGYRYKAHPAALCGHIKKVNLLDIVNGFNSFAEKILGGDVRIAV